MTKKYFAGFQLAALHTLRPLILICLVLAVLQLGGFCFYFFTGDGATPFVDLFHHYGMHMPFRMAIVAMMIFAMTALFTKNATGYLMRRLALSDSRLGLLWSLNSLLCFLILWCFEIILLLLCNFIFQTNTDPAYWSHQSFFVACYNSDFLHAILPMGDVTIWVRNLIMFLALALTTGSGMVAHWRGEQAKLWLFAMTLWGWSFQSWGEGLDIIFGIVFFVIALSALNLICAREEKL